MKITIDIKPDSIAITIGRTTGTHRRTKAGWVLPAAENTKLNAALVKAADISEAEAEDALDNFFLPLMELADSMENT